MATKLILQAVTSHVFPPAENVSLLLHGNGNFLDHAFSPATITPNGTISTVSNPNTGGDYNKFSTSSIYTASTGYLSAPTDDKYRVGTGAFTIEGFVYPTTGYGTSYAIWFDTREVGVGPGIFLGFNSGNGQVRTCIGTVFTGSHDSDGSIQPNEWSHIALVRYDTIDPETNTNAAIYLNGNLDKRFLATADVTGGAMTVGQDVSRDNNYAFSGYLNEVRLTKGVAVYSGASFTVPSARFPNAG